MTTEHAKCEGALHLITRFPPLLLFPCPPRVFVLQPGSIQTLTPVSPVTSLQPAPPPQLSYSCDRVPQEPSYQAPSERLFYLLHTCSAACLSRVRPAHLDQYRSRNPLLTPLLYEFRRMTGRRRVNRKVIWGPALLL